MMCLRATSAMPRSRMAAVVEGERVQQFGEQHGGKRAMLYLRTTSAMPRSRTAAHGEGRGERLSR